MIKFSELLNELLAQYPDLANEADYMDDRNIHNAIEFGLRVPVGQTIFSAYGAIDHVNVGCYFVATDENSLLEDLKQLLK